MTAGVLVLDKPEGPTSHDLVAVARRALGERRIGHCGTLDPLATGVLALAVGPATRLVQFLVGADKYYTARVRFGIRTTTYDVLGETVATSPVRPRESELEHALEAFRGDYQQVPPAYSAKKVGGHRAYRLARRTDTLPPVLAPVPVSVRALRLDAYQEGIATLTLQVSAGFYVRSLADDLGQRLGMGAALEGLRRTGAGPFELEQAVSVEDLARQPRDWLQQRLIPLAALLPDLPRVVLADEAAARACRGVDLPCPPDQPLAAPLTRLFDEGGQLLALAVPAARPGFLHPSVVLG